MKLHPLSALATALQRGIQVGSVPFTLVMFLNVVVSVDFMLGIYLLPVGFVVGAGYGLAYYRSFSYTLTSDTFDVDSGVLNRQERDVPYHRIQNVDVHQSLLHRLFDVAVVSVETAGGAQTEITLDFVSAAEAERLQSAIRDHKHSERGSGDRSSESTPTEDEVTGLLFELSIRRLVVLALTDIRSGSVILGGILVGSGQTIARSVLLSIAAPFGGPTSLAFEALSPRSSLVLLVVSILSACFWVWLVNAVVVFTENYGFTLGRSGEDLVYEFGLLNRSSGSIPLSKIQTLTVTEPVLARSIGWAGLKAETAGYAPGGQNRGGTEYVVPLAPRAITLEIATAIEQFGSIEVERPPKRARRRYIGRYSIVVGGLLAGSFLVQSMLTPISVWYLPALLFVAVPVAAHCKWKHRGYRLGEEHIVVRDGFWRRTTRIVPYHRLQTIRLERSVFQRRLGLADLTADTASETVLFSNDATAFDIDRATASTSMERWRARFRDVLEL